MNTEKLALGWGKIAEGAMEISLAYSAIDPAVARTAVPDRVPTAPAGSAAGSAPLPPAAPDIPMKPQVDAGLAICPIHGKPWTIKAAGVSKAGKRYSAFYKCSERDSDGFCNEKPQPIWVDTHPIPGAAAA